MLGQSSGAEGAAVPPLVFLSDKSGRATGGCPSAAFGVAWLLPDGTAAPVRCTASNRCPYCARIAAFEVMTMLRIDAEENDAPTHIVTLTSRRVLREAALREAHAVFWRGFRRASGSAPAASGRARR